MTCLFRLGGLFVSLTLAACTETGPCGDCTLEEESSTSSATTSSSTTDATSTTATTDPTTSTSTTTADPSSSTDPTTGEPDCAVHVELSGADQDGCGPAGNPCRTVTRALTLASAGCPVLVGPGTFDEAGGEQFPLQLGDGIEVAGAGHDPALDPTILDHSPGGPLPVKAYGCPLGESIQHSGALLLAGAGPRLRDVIVKAPIGQTEEVAIMIESGDVTLERVRVEGGAEGIFIAGEGTTATLLAITATRAGHAAVKPGSTAVVTIEDSVFFGNKDAVEPICDATTTIRNTEAYCNGNGLEALDNADTILHDNYVHHNNVGIGGRGDITFFGRGNRVENNQIGALAWFGPADFGTADDPGGNSFKDNVIAGLFVIRVPGDITAIGNTWQPGVDGADPEGKFSGAVQFDPPQCPFKGLMNLDVPPPPSCTGTEPVAPDPGYRNVAIEDGSCFAGMPVPTGSVVVSVP